MSEQNPVLPIVDIAPLVAGTGDRAGTAAIAVQIGQACRQSGFFYVVDHGVDEGVQTRLSDLSRTFFAQD